MAKFTKATPISARQPECVVEYDTARGRISKHFTDAYAARRFFVSKYKQGKNPAVKKGDKYVPPGVPTEYINEEDNDDDN